MSKKEDLRVIRDEIFSLTQSPLYAYRIENNYVPVLGEGSYDAKIMFIGEAPGKNEAKTGKPFCGASGRLLDELLGSIGLPRESVYVTNIIKDRPPENRDPTPKEIDLYAPFLDRQIEIIQPNVIATLGRHSMNYIMKRYSLDSELEPISKAHGKQYKTEVGNVALTIVPLYHPAVALYNGSQKQILLEDFKILKQCI